MDINIDDKKIRNLFYMNHLKQFGKDDDELQELILTVK